MRRPTADERGHAARSNIGAPDPLGDQERAEQQARRRADDQRRASTSALPRSAVDERASAPLNDGRSVRPPCSGITRLVDPQQRHRPSRHAERDADERSSATHYQITCRAPGHATATPVTAPKTPNATPRLRSERRDQRAVANMTAPPMP
jgi:hypothetical protein